MTDDHVYKAYISPTNLKFWPILNEVKALIVQYDSCGDSFEAPLEINLPPILTFPESHKALNI